MLLKAAIFWAHHVAYAQSPPLLEAIAAGMWRELGDQRAEGAGENPQSSAAVALPPSGPSRAIDVKRGESLGAGACPAPG